MTRDEYKDIPVPEAEVTFHKNPAEGVTYVKVEWETPLEASHGARAVHGFKFTVSDELLWMWAKRIE